MGQALLNSEWEHSSETPCGRVAQTGKLVQVKAESEADWWSRSVSQTGEHGGRGDLW